MNSVFQIIKAAMDQARNDQSISCFRECCMDLGVQETDDGAEN